MIEKNGIGISLTEEGYLRTLCTNRNQTSESLLCLTRFLAAFRIAMLHGHYNLQARIAKTYIPSYLRMQLAPRY